MFQKRIPRGRAMKGDLVATDAIALLSGVNFGSVVKVLAAVKALELHTGVDVATIVKFENIPTEPAQFDGSDEARVVATDSLIQTIIRDPKVDFTDHVLRHKRRFAATTL